MTIRALVVDDEPLARERLRQLTEGVDDVVLVGECGNGAEALVEIERHRPDLVFLDVEMPEMDGFEVLRALGPESLPFIVFVTAYGQYALRAFDVHALDYLVKPVTRARFLATLQRARTEIRRRSSEAGDRLRELLDWLPDAPARRSRLAVRADGRIVFLAPAEILWISAEGNYVRLHRATSSMRARGTLGALHDALDPSTFLRIHRSTIVNLDHVREIRPLPRGDHELVMADGTALRLARRYWSGLEAVLSGRP